MNQNCTYTAQGKLVCGSVTTKEQFVVREDPNESGGNWCSPVQKAFMEAATKHNCDVSANANKCEFSFACHDPSKK